MARGAARPSKPFGHRWRSSGLYIIAIVSVALFSGWSNSPKTLRTIGFFQGILTTGDSTDNFLFTFIIPILPEILESRLQQPAARIQALTSIILSMNALVSIILAPVTGYVADKLSSRNWLLIAAWVVNMFGTAVTAWSTTLTGLIIGRLIQTVAGSVIWIVGMAMLANAAGARHLSKAFGVAVLLVSAGLLTGPAVSAALYKFVSYGVMWSSAFLVLLTGLILQLLVLEPRGDGARASTITAPNDRGTRDEEQDSEAQTLDATTAPLLPSSPAAEARSYTYHTTTTPTTTTTTAAADTDPPSPAGSSTPEKANIYWLILRKKRVAAGLLGDTLLAVVIASFEATIPLHIREVFRWDSFHAGLLFLLLQAPTLLLVVPVGGLKDRVGLRYPVSLGFGLLAPSLVLLGLPGHQGFLGTSGAVVYLVSLVAIGVWRTLILGYGGVEVLNGANELADEKPGIFGSNGGYSRTFSLSNVTWKGGMFVGPLVSGALTEAVGYFYMNLVLGTIELILTHLIPPFTITIEARNSCCIMAPQVIVLAGGTGGFGRYLAEAITSSPDYAVAILTRSNKNPPPWTDHPKITTHQTDYTPTSLLPILNTTQATTLLSLIRCPNDAYLPLHTHLLDACIASQTCKRLIPSEWAGNVDDFPLLPRSYGGTRAPFREILRSRAASHHVEWTLVHHGWFMDYFLPDHKSYMAYIPGEFPVDPQTWTYHGFGQGGGAVVGAGAVGMFFLPCLDWRLCADHREMAGRPFKREYRSVEQIEYDVEHHPTPPDDPNIALAELEECTIKGAICCPREKTLRQKEEFFAGMEFVRLEELLVRAERGGFT
ncbi:MFS general substrate transporter [Aspergillus brunneoviolaceus CBS 621.78]|uniref:MFS general substrate transporter n=1 Tax=Aspergillus brunneoviolaceus CBS 621.78 TaxID=1450534 RepID=A0ACD1GC18_9EURO|nr:MFS general substrate transporter [Aspergillus brunneoviolaceus CBS 621.78]RAH46775.1 MFS general substrate transporter [Aspergillus brunneoviolaceus CBS 621.78]